MTEKSIRFSLTVTVVLLLIASTGLIAQTAREWLEKLDRQMFYRSAEYTAKMIIHSPGGTDRTFTMTGKVVAEVLVFLFNYTVMKYWVMGPNAD